MIPLPGQKYAYFALAFLLAVGASFGYGRFSGYRNGIEAQKQKTETARLATQEELFELGETILIQANELERLQRERVQLVHDLEQSAIQAPGSSNPGVAANGGLLRLQRRWGAPGPSAQ